MEILRTRADLRRLDPWRHDERPLVLVPTMGALHDGHAALVRRAAALGTAVVSIFVNPSQFGPGEDYAGYPRDLERDLALLEPLGTAAVFAPGVRDMSPRDGGVRVEPGPRGAPLCGARRPGHFAGVLTAVAKLFNLVRPDVAVFGRKDAQQCLVIAEMVEDLGMTVTLEDHPTVREDDGLALSSRNRYLGAPERVRALCLWRALQAGAERLREGERSPVAVAATMRAELAAADGVDYAEVRRVPDLNEPERAEGRLLLAVAARVGKARLIDNLVLAVGDDGVRETDLLGDATR
ncbi:MAG: pantoate--beta-alanine ligase [Candidatus Krumholzibacteriia bacterium]